MKAPKTVLLFSNGHCACFDKDGEQIGELQEKGWIELWLEWLETKGVNPLEIEKIEANINGRDVYIKPFKTEFGWNYEITEKVK